MGKGLLVVDFQEEWRKKDSEYYLGDFSKKINNAKKLIEFCRQKTIPVIFTRHIEPESEKEFAENSKSSRIISELTPRKQESIIVKNKISPFFKTDLEKELIKLGIDELIICGIMTNLCVRSAVSDAYDRDFAINLVTDACVSDSNETDKFTFEDIKKTRPEVQLLTTAELLVKG